MAVSEQALAELRTRLEQVLGTEEAATLMDHLPGDQPASRADLRELGNSVDERFEAVDQRFDAVDRRFVAVDQRFDAVDRRFDALEHRFSIVDIKLEELEKRLDDRIDARAETMEQRLLGVASGIREDFALQLIAQTRVFMFSTISALITLAALTLAFVRT